MGQRNGSMYWWNIRGDSDILDDLRYIDERGRDGGFNSDHNISSGDTTWEIWDTRY